MGMRIEYRTPAGNGGWSMLAEDGGSNTGLGDQISGFRPDLSKSPQVDDLAFSASPFIADTGNGKWSMDFLVERIHSDADAALLFLATHLLIFNMAPRQQMDLRITVGTRVTYLLGAVPTKVAPDPHSDQSTRVSYAFIAPNYTATAPS